jgi:hypothetical protein
MKPIAADLAGASQVRQRRIDGVMTISSLLLLLALAAAAFGQGGFFIAVQLFVVTVLAVVILVAVIARKVPVADLRGWFVLAGALLAGWALIRAAAAGTPASGLAWVLFGAGTSAVVLVSRRLDADSRLMLLGGLLAVGILVALTGWLGVALHLRPWGLPSQSLWRAASTLTYPNATAALLVPLALIALARLTASPKSVGLSLTATCLLAGAGATISRAGLAALAVGLLALCSLLGARSLARAAAGPVAGAVVALLGLVPSLRASAPARPVVAVVAAVGGLMLVVLVQRVPGRRLTLLIAGAALAAAFFMILRAPQVRNTAHAFTRARLTVDSSARSGEAAAALRIVSRHPLTGVGPGHAILRWTSTDGAVNADRYAHDEYLQVLTDLGIVGAALATLFLVMAGRLLWRVRAGPPDRALWAGAVAATVAFALHSGFDFLWQVPAIPFTVAAIVGLATCQSPARRHTPSAEPLHEGKS